MVPSAWSWARKKIFGILFIFTLEGYILGCTCFFFGKGAFLKHPSVIHPKRRFPQTIWIFRRKIVWERGNYQFCNMLEIKMKRHLQKVCRKVFRNMFLDSDLSCHLRMWGTHSHFNALCVDWLTHFWRKMLSSQFTHFFRRFLILKNRSCRLFHF